MMAKHELTQNVVACAKKFDADLVAIGSADRFEGTNVFEIYPDVKSVICIAYRVLRGSHRGIEEGTTYYQYSTTGIETNQRGLLTVNEDGSTTREGVFAGGDAVMGARTVVEAVAIAKKVAASMDSYMKSLPVDTTPDPYADIPVVSTPTTDALAKQDI